MEGELTTIDRARLRVQTLIDWLFFPVVGLSVLLYLKYIKRNRIGNVRELREAYARIVAEQKPTMVCANHLTMFDSLYLHYALSTVWGYFTHFKRFSWNVPAVETFKVNPFMNVFTFLGKTIPIDRQGSSEHHKKVLDKIRYLLRRGEICTIFPEGGRSRTGRVEVENVTYGVGNILKDMEDYRVLCIYMRGENQTRHTVMPKTGDEIFVRLELMKPTTSQKGMRGARDISTQIIQKLKEMEEDYFRQKLQSPDAGDAGK